MLALRSDLETTTAVAQGTVLVTGGTGSFGSTMVRRLLEADVAEVRIFSRDELKQDDMRRALGDSRVRFYIGDVRDFDSVDRATRGVDFVFHAAALKQVPSCEFFPMEAVRTNVLGSRQRDRGQQQERRRARSSASGLTRRSTR